MASFSMQEYPAPVPPDEPHWNESFLLAGYDRHCGVGFWTHLGRWRSNQQWWREIFTIALPDGTVLVHRGIGNAQASDKGPGATNFSIRVEEPGKRLSYCYRGGVGRVQAAALATGLLTNGSMTPLEMDLVFEATTPVWDLHQNGGSQDFLGAGHIEQIGRVTGVIKVSSERFELDAMGTRDKSIGRRKPGNLQRHHWVQGLFENGIGFMLFDAEEGEKGFNEAVVTHSNRLFKAKATIPWRIEHLDQQNEPVRFTLKYDEGVLDIVTEAMPNSWYLSYTTPIDTYIGVYPVPGHTPRVLLEQSVHWLLNGTTPGLGAMERTVPGTIGTEPG